MSETRRILTMSLVTLILGTILMVAHSRVLSNFKAETERLIGSPLFSLGDDAKDGIEVHVTITAIDRTPSAMTVRLEFTPKGKYVNANDSLSVPLIVDVNSLAGKSEYRFKASEAMGPIEFDTGRVGSSAYYPFDHQDASIYVTMTCPEERGKGGTFLAPVPIQASGDAHVGGFHITMGENQTGQSTWGEGYFYVTLHVERSRTVIQFAVMIMTLQWMLALTAYLVALQVVAGRRRLEVNLFSWLTGLLFSLPPLRNLMVGAPPIGIYADFLAFLWCEGIVALSLVALVLTWIWRRPD